MKPLTIALMIATLIVPAAAHADDHRDYGREGRGQVFRPYEGPGGGYRPYNGGQGPQRPGRQDLAVPGLGPIFRGFPEPGGYGGPRLRPPGDWNDYGSPRGGPARWRRGQVFPPAYRGAIVGDYYRYHLRRPPPGYYWYRNGDDFILAALASGLIFEVVSADDY
jgi:Ni/Co efflux regulator RcnB